MTWNELFEDLFDRCVDLYQRGNTDMKTWYHVDDLTFLKLIGYKPREFFDFVEDYCEDKEPARSTALLVAAARRDYFLVVQKGQPSDKIIGSDDVPSRREDLEGFNYLPRLIEKAKAKLRGELDPDLMFCCGGDRAFLREHGNIHPADFLRQVWAADGDNDKVLAFIESHLDE